MTATLSPLTAVEPSGPVARPRVRRRRRFGNYLFVIPALILMAALVYYSLGYTVVLSAFDTNGVSARREFVGFDNYLRAFTDSGFLLSLRNVAIFFLLIPVQLLVGFGFAVVLQSRIRFATVYKVIIFLPVVLAPAVMAPVFVEMFSPGGTVSELLHLVGLGALSHAWLADPATAVWVLALIQVWSGTGFCFVIYLASLTQIEPSVLEAGRMDGAGNLRLLWSIVLPMVRAATVTLVVLCTIGTIKVFDIPQIITQGGPANSTQFLATYIYQQTVQNYAAGYGAAITVMLVIACLGLAIAQLRLSKRSER